MLRDGTLTYVSLFSSAGVGCHGFKQENYRCIATCEINPRRMDVQRYNAKCDFDSGYIVGDISEDSVKQQIIKEIDLWSALGNDQVDVIMATPPCQGISVINHKKKNEIVRNSLVVESIKIVQDVHPRFFVFENVLAFSRALCVNPQGINMPIGEYIAESLGDDYIISTRVLNFMNYGSNSSRTRTLVIGVSRKYKNTIAPYDLFPVYRKDRTLRQVIGDFAPLEWGEICADDFYHAFRTYNKRMRPWIHDLKEGESAFDNDDPEKRPNHIVDGKIVPNVRKNRDKYTRQLWDRFPQCITTRNDQLAAQSTIHPEQDRVLSVRELMKLMTIPDDFKWVNLTLEELNSLNVQEKRAIYKQNEMNIRQCIGEAVPTQVIREIAHAIKMAINEPHLDAAGINRLIAANNLSETSALKEFLVSEENELAISSLQRIVELCNGNREKNAAYYTNRFLVNKIINRLPSFSKAHIRILEPSVGAGSFLPLLFKRYDSVPRVTLDVVDIDGDSIEILKSLLKRMSIPSNFEINFHSDDFLTLELPYRFDLAIGNPPFSKIRNASPELRKALEENVNKETNDMAEAFLEKCLRESDYVALVLNKTLLFSAEFSATREWLRHMRINSIVDFGRKGFTGVSIETMCLMIQPKLRPSQTEIYNVKFNRHYIKDQGYITDPEYPCFLIYRDDRFDDIAMQLKLGVFDVFRDRQITKSNSTKISSEGSIWVLKAKNIDDAGGGVKHLEGYDAYISEGFAKQLSAYRYVDDASVYLTPNMTYNTRVIRNIKRTITDGSVAVLIPKSDFCLSERQLEYFASEDFRYYYGIARNLSTQSINVDKQSVYFFGVLKDA